MSAERGSNSTTRDIVTYPLYSGQKHFLSSTALYSHNPITLGYAPSSSQFFGSRLLGVCGTTFSFSINLTRACRIKKKVPNEENI